MTSDPEFRQNFDAKFAEHDKNKKGSLNKEQFVAFYLDLGGPFGEASKLDVLFDGIDIDNSKLVTKQELLDFIDAALNNDMLTIFKIVFRAFDKDRSSILDVNEIVELVKFSDMQMTIEEAKQAVEEITGQKDGQVTFAVLYKLMTSTEIDPKTDPYDGKLKKPAEKKSGCCHLI